MSAPNTSMFTLFGGPCSGDPCGIGNPCNVNCSQQQFQSYVVIGVPSKPGCFDFCDELFNGGPGNWGPNNSFPLNQSLAVNVWDNSGNGPCAQFGNFYLTEQHPPVTAGYLELTTGNGPYYYACKSRVYGPSSESCAIWLLFTSGNTIIFEEGGLFLAINHTAVPAGSVQVQVPALPDGSYSFELDPPLPPGAGQAYVLTMACGPCDPDP